MKPKDFLGGQWSTAPRAQTPPTPPYSVLRLLVASVEPDLAQPRKFFDEESLRQLGETIRERGQLQPIRVRRVAGSTRYVIVAGERRWRASKMVGLETIDAIVLDDRVDIASVQVEQMLENLQRADFTPAEEAEQYARLMAAHGWSQAELARRLGKGTATISRALSLLKPAEPVEEKRASRPRRRKVAPTDKRRAATYETKAAGVVRVKRGYSLEQLVDELRQMLEAELQAKAA